MILKIEETLATFFNRKGLCIVVTAFFGIIILFSVLWLTGTLLTEKDLVDLIKKNPPWILIPTIVSGPPLLYIWYLRTTFKDKEIKNKESEINCSLNNQVIHIQNNIFKDIEHANLAIIQAHEILASTPSIILINKMIEAVASGLKHQSYSIYHSGMQLKTGGEQLYREFAQKAFGLISFYRSYHPEEIDLKNIILDQCDLSNLDLRHINFSGATFNGVVFKSSNLSWSVFNNCNEKSSVVFDDDTIIDDSQKNNMNNMRSNVVASPVSHLLR